MASVMALNEGWTSTADQVDEIEFVGTSVCVSDRPWRSSREDAVNDSFKNLRDSVNDGSTAAFMWEW